ncbi:Serine/threonine/tyrosine-interacting protein [Takifugu flavidus]|uniref:Serine/threonine/tyrosine-interacting protein n=1 Tax=Takifugu flavidus TaxID=433684 RepID=A0A5C6NJF7_9TELE|nr:Serine/threonine/tyrosine-interacting protein [Takifugu flavidus]
MRREMQEILPGLFLGPYSSAMKSKCCLSDCVPYGNIWDEVQEYEAIYLAKLTIKMMSPMQLGRSFSLQAGVAGSRKRSLEEDEDFGAMQVAAAHNR